MKKLSHFVIEVRTQAELTAAIRFYQRASRRPLNYYTRTSLEGLKSLFVGMDGREVNAGNSKYSFETVIPFGKMDMLADTASRQMALKVSGWDKLVSVAVKPVKPKATVEKNPLIRFAYPSSKHYGYPTTRNVRLVSADTKYFVGLEILPENKFAFKKFLKAKALQVEVLEFNPKN